MSVGSPHSSDLAFCPNIKWSTTRGHPDYIQGSGNASNHQEHQCVVQHIVLLSLRRFARITESSMDPQFTHLTHSILRSCFLRKLSTGPSQSSVTRNPPHRAHAISPPIISLCTDAAGSTNMYVTPYASASTEDRPSVRLGNGYP